ncbi:MAG: nucleoside deaminase [Clostridia bacterium]
MNKFMKEAIIEAEIGIGKGCGGPFGAVVVKGEKIVGRGHNEVLKNNDPTAHAEVQAIRDACKNLGTYDLQGCEIYATGQPCPMCFGAIQWANIGHIFFGGNEQDIENIGFRDKKFRNEGSAGNLDQTEISRKECLKLFQTYCDMPNKTNY